MVPHINTVTKAQNFWRYLRSVLWNSLSSEIRNNENLYSFKIELKSFTCPCGLCKDYVSGFGFANIITWSKSFCRISLCLDQVIVVAVVNASVNRRGYCKYRGYCKSHHASVLKIKEARNSPDCFSFKLVTVEDICRKIRALDGSKSTQSDDIPTKIIKNNSDNFLGFFKRILITLLKQVLFQSNWNMLM